MIQAVLTFLALVLWFGGLYGMLAGYMLPGAFAVMAAIWVSAKAFSKPNDMESFFGFAFGLVLLGGAIIGLVEGYRWLVA